jgi:Spy/CpxP family protein refolding chaperone
VKRLAAALILAACASAAAQEAAPPAGRPPRPDRPDREEAFRMVDAYIAGKLQESLGLTDDQFAKVLPMVTQLHRDRREVFHRRQQLLRELRRTLASGTATEAEVQQGLAEVKRLENDEHVRLRRDREAVDAALTPLQQAKFRVLEAEVEQKIRSLRMRGGRPGPHRRGPDDEPRPQP